MKLWKISSYLTLALLAPCLLFSGCGGGSNGAVVTTVSVISSQGNNLILGQSANLTATVVGPTNTNVTWVGCTFTIIPATPVGNTTPSTAAPCPKDPNHSPSDPNFTIFGSLTNEQATGSATFTATSTLPDPTKFPSLVVIITVQAVGDSSKHGTGTISLTIESGVTVQVSPNTAAVPTNEKQPFFALLANDTQNKGVTWFLTQSTPTSTTPTTPNAFVGLPTCTVSGNATGCGSIDTNGVYTAPTTVPTASVPANASTTPTDVTIVATSVEDPTRFALGTITITQGGPITFNGIAPNIAPQGAAFWDIYLNAPNLSSASQITLTDANGGTTALNSVSGQVKVLFPIPTGTVTNPSSIGARIRLFSNNLAVASANPITVSVTDAGQPVTTNPTGVFTFNILPVRPTAVASTPADVIQGQGGVNGDVDLAVDGGYFGDAGQLASVTYQGVTISGTTTGTGQPVSNSKQLHVQFPSAKVNNGLPGLYTLATGRTTAPLPFADNSAVTDLAVFPNYGSNPPVLVGSPIAAGTNPSAIDIDPTLGVVAVAETGSNAVQFYTVGQGTLTPAGGPIPVGKVPTGLSINRTNHTVAVVNYQDQSVTVLPIPGAPAAPGTPFTLDISGVLQGQVSPAPLPYSIGVDPDTNMGIVAYSSTSASSAANLGFLLNLNVGVGGCLGGTPAVGPCVSAQVTLNTGVYPQIAMAPHGHLAFVTPGGSGFLQGVDVTKSSTSAFIQSLTIAAGIVTVTTTAANGLVPGDSGTVLITGVPGPGTAGNSTTANFNGVFSVSAVSDTSFSYIINSTASGTVTLTPPDPNNPTVTASEVFYSTPNLIFGGLSQTTQGISINPVTNTAALADANATGSNGPQINLINNLDQTISSISFFSDCTFYTTTFACSNAPELLGTADVAWQPYSNAIVSYNPGLNQVSVSDPVTSTRYALACGVQTAACLVNPGTAADQGNFNTQTTLPGTGTATLTVVNGTTNSLKLFGGLAVDPVTNQAFVVMSGSNQIDVIDLGPCRATPPVTGIPTPCPNPFNTLKTTQISEILVPSPNPGPGVIGGIPHANVPQGTLTSAADLAGVQIFGSGFDASTQVRLDGTAIPAGNVQFVNGREVTATIPASFLSFPHRYALDVVNGSGVQSNATDFFVVQAVDLTKVCAGPVPSSVAVADQLVNMPFAPIAVVTNSGCNSISVVDINPADAPAPLGTGPNAGKFGTVLNTIGVGAGPQGIAVSQPFGLAVVANNGAGTASVVNLVTNALAVPDVTTGTSPAGVAINDATGAAIVANTGSNTITEINLGLLFGSSAVTTLAGTPVTIGGFQLPTAVAIDPDRGTNNQGIAVITALQLVNGTAPQGALQVVDIGLPTPILSSTAATGNITSPTTGIVFDPTISTGTQNNGVFYASSSGGNVITSFNPDNGAANTVNVGINPTALALNPQTGAILTTNFAGQTASLVDTSSSPLKTVKTIGLPGSGQFGVAIDQFTNLAVIVDQANNRLLIFAMPN
jgi:DNA-binding beta-propeller fold protein YncE